MELLLLLLCFLGTTNSFISFSSNKVFNQLEHFRCTLCTTRSSINDDHDSLESQRIGRKETLMDFCDSFSAAILDRPNATLLQNKILESIVELVSLRPNGDAFLQSNIEQNETMQFNVNGNWKILFSNKTPTKFYSKVIQKRVTCNIQSLDSISKTLSNIYYLENDLTKSKQIQLTSKLSSLDNGIIGIQRSRFKLINPSRKFLKQISLPLFRLPFLRRRRTLQILYLDDDLRIDRNEKGEYDVYTRVHEAWDPMKGWTWVSGC